MTYRSQGILFYAVSAFIKVKGFKYLKYEMEYPKSKIEKYAIGKNEQKSKRKIIFVTFPANLSFQEPYINDTFYFFNELRKFIKYKQNKRNISDYIEIQSCQYIHLGCALVLTALLEESTKKGKFNNKDLDSRGYQISNIKGWSMQVLAMLQKFGCLEYLEVKIAEPVKKEIKKEVVKIPYRKITCMGGEKKAGAKVT